jgi:hypothetical protein
MKKIIIAILFLSCLNVHSQTDNHTGKEKFIPGINIGAGTAYADKAFNHHIAFSLTIDYHIKKGFFLQFAPKYSWLWKWNEHYLTLPVHLRKMFGDKISIFAGPALTFDIGYFKDLGISAGGCYHFSRRSAVILSAFTFTLYDYYIDYLYVPVSLSYQITF